MNGGDSNNGARVKWASVRVRACARVECVVVVVVWVSMLRHKDSRCTDAGTQCPHLWRNPFRPCGPCNRSIMITSKARHNLLDNSLSNPVAIAIILPFGFGVLPKYCARAREQRQEKKAAYLFHNLSKLALGSLPQLGQLCLWILSRRSYHLRSTPPYQSLWIFD